KTTTPIYMTPNTSKVSTITFCGSGKASTTLAGTLPTAAVPLSLAGKTLAVDVGGFAKTFTLNARGAGKTGDDTFALGRARKGLVPSTATIRRDDVSDELADEGLTGDMDLKNAPRSVVVTLTF